MALTSDDLDRLAALKVELAERKKSKAARPDFMGDLYPSQRAVFDSPGKDKAILAGRRWGKSIGLSRWLLDGCWEQPRSEQLYTSKTRLHAKQVLWQPLLDALRAHGFTRVNQGRPQGPREYQENATELTLTFANGSSIRLGGTKDRGEVDKFRGGKYFRMAVDESGVVPPSILGYLAEEVLEPASVDWDGETIFAGTPGLVAYGYWYDLTGPKKKMGIPVFTGTMFDNPHIPHAREVAAKIKAKHGWADDHPTWVREYLGEWIFDMEGSIFPWTPEDSVPALPALHKDAWTVVLAIDVGQVNANGYCMWASHANSPDDFILKSWKAPRQLIDEMAEDIRKAEAWVRELLGVPDQHVIIVIDTGGMGKQHEQELQRRKGIPVHAADKREKRSAMIVLGDRVRSRRVKIVEGQQNDAVRDDWAVSRWNDTRTDFEEDTRDESSHLDVAHASLYGHRRLRNYLYEKEEKVPLPGTPEYAKLEEAQMLEAHRRKYTQRDTGRPSWDN